MCVQCIYIHTVYICVCVRVNNSRSHTVDGDDHVDEQWGSLV